MGREVIADGKAKTVARARIHAEWFRRLFTLARERGVRYTVMVEQAIADHVGMPFEQYHAEYAGAQAWSDHVRGMLQELFDLPDVSDLPRGKSDGTEWDKITTTIARRHMKVLIAMGIAMRCTPSHIVADMIERYCVSEPVQYVIKGK